MEKIEKNNDEENKQTARAVTGDNEVWGWTNTTRNPEWYH